MNWMCRDICHENTLTFVLLSLTGNNVGEVQFDTLSGPLFAKNSENGISLNMPLNMPEQVKVTIII